MNNNKRIYLIGCGNLGLHLGVALKEKGYIFSGVYSRKVENSKKASKLLQCQFIENLYNVPENADIIIISVPDKALIDISKKIFSPKQTIIHTSGSVEMDVLKNISPKHGVFYPLQTFSLNKSITFKNIPIFIEASDNDTLDLLSKMSQILEAEPNILNSEKRKILHLAAVFACNFSNFMIYNAEKILEDNDLKKEFLHPLIKETFLKAIENGAVKSQTGPAVRGDAVIVDKHLKMLAEDVKKKEIYDLLSTAIRKSFAK